MRWLRPSTRNVAIPTSKRATPTKTQRSGASSTGSGIAKNWALLHAARNFAAAVRANKTTTERLNILPQKSPVRAALLGPLRQDSDF